MDMRRPQSESHSDKCYHCCCCDSKTKHPKARMSRAQGGVRHSCFTTLRVDTWVRTLVINLNKYLKKISWHKHFIGLFSPQLSIKSFKYCVLPKSYLADAFSPDVLVYEILPCGLDGKLVHIKNDQIYLYFTDGCHVEREQE